MKKVLDDVAKRYDASGIFLDITGGEPLMRKDLFEFTKYANELGYVWGMTTNGMLINDRILKQIEETKMASVSVSLDGLEKTHDEFRQVPGSFNKIVINIKKLLKVPTINAVQITTVVNEKNIEELEELYKLVLDLGVKYWRVITIDPIGRAKGNDEILLTKKNFKRVLEVEYLLNHLTK